MNINSYKKLLIHRHKYPIVQFKSGKSQLLEKFDKSFIPNMRCLFQFIQDFDQPTNLIKFYSKQVKLFHINNLIEKAVQKGHNYVYMTDPITAIDSHCKKTFVTYRFENCRKCCDIVKSFFLLISVSYPLCFVLQDISKPIFFQFEVSFFHNDISFI